MDHLQYKRVWLGMGALVLVAVLIVSLIRLPSIFETIMKQDKLLHTMAYFCLMAWFAQIFRHWLTRLLLAVALMAFGLGMEVVQGMLPTRKFDTMDMAANTSGILLAWALAYTWVGNMFVKAEQFYMRCRDMNLLPLQGSELT